MAKTNLQSYLDDVRKELSSDIQFPRITQAEIDYNLEMMPVDDEDACKMFLAGIITNMMLMDILSGKAVIK